MNDTMTDENGESPHDAAASRPATTTPPWEEPVSVATKKASAGAIWRRSLTFAGVTAVIAVLAAFFVWELSRRYSPSVGDARQASRLGGSLNPGSAEFYAQSEPESFRQVSTENASRRAEVLTTQARLSDLRSDLESLAAGLSGFESEVQGLLQSDLGRRVAADPAAVDVLIPLFERERITTEGVQRLQSVVMALSLPVEEAVEDPSSVLEIDAKFAQQLDEVRQRVDAESKSLADDERRVRLLSRDAESREPASATLADAIDTLKAKRLRESNAQVAAAAQRQRNQAVAAEAAAQAEIERVESERRLAEQELEKKKREAELAGVQAEQRRLETALELARKKAALRLRFESEASQVRSTLTPFIASGRKQIVDGEWRMTEEDQPVSLSGLESIGALKDTQMGAQALYYAAGGRVNDRPNGPFAAYIGGHIHDDKMPLVLRTQRYLRDYGELLVEDGLLKP